MRSSSTRWNEISASQFPWEQEALTFAREKLPDEEPCRAWSNFEFIGEDGSINEIDLLVLSKRGFYLIEIKSRPGVVTGDAGTWIWHVGGRTLSYDNPLLLANRKAKKLRKLLAVRSGDRRGQIPFLTPIVFLSAKDAKCRLDESGRGNVVLRKPKNTDDGDKIEALDDLFTGVPNDLEAMRQRNPIEATTASFLDFAMERAGIRPTREDTRFGDYDKGKLLFEGPSFQDFEATHVAIPSVVHRMRVYSVPEDADAKQRSTVIRAAQREFKVLQGISHPGILRVLNYHEAKSGPVLVFERENGEQRLDLFLREREQPLTHAQKLQLLKSMAQALLAAHAKQLFHRAFSPRSVLVRSREADLPEVRVFNWHTAARQLTMDISAEERMTGTFSLKRLVDEDTIGYMAPEAFLAPDDAASLDVFSLGAVTYHLFTGRAPATDLLELSNMLREHDGLDVSELPENEVPGIGDLVQRATRLEPAQRSPLDELSLELEILAEGLPA